MLCTLSLSPTLRTAWCSFQCLIYLTTSPLKNIKVLSNFSLLQSMCMHVSNFKLRLDAGKELLRNFYF